MKKIVILSIMMAILFFNQFAVAAGTSITARVGDAIITSHDVETRLNILFLASDLPNDDKVKQQLRRQIRELLIDEEIQRQVAKREEIKIDKKELDETYRNIEKRNNIPNGKLFDEMKKKGIEKIETDFSLITKDSIRRTFLLNLQEKISLYKISK